MVQCEVCGSECKGRTCSGACRAKMSRKAHGTGARSEAHALKRTVRDSTGQEHPINYEGRQKRYNLLKAWAEGQGTLGQQVMGRLGLTYNLIKGLDLNSYLGVQA